MIPEAIRSFMRAVRDRFLIDFMRYILQPAQH